MTRAHRAVTRAGLALLLVAIPTLPHAAVQRTALDRIAVFGVESAGAARGPWMQMYDGTGQRVVNVFLDDDYPDYEIRTLDLDGDGEREIVALATDAAEGRAQLQVRSADGSRVDAAAAAEGEAFASMELSTFVVDEARYVGVVHTDALGAVRMESWRLQSSGGGASRTLVREGQVELLPAGSLDALVAAADVDGDGADEIVVVYPGPGGRGVRAKALRPFTGNVLYDRRAYPAAFDRPALVVGDFRPERAGLEVMVGAQRRGNGKGFARLLEAGGRPLISRGRVTPARATELVWQAIEAPVEAGARVNGTAVRLLVGYRDREGVGEARVLDLEPPRPDRLTTLALCPGETQMVAGDFDADPASGDEIAALCTLPDRSTEFRFFDQDGTAGATGQAFEATAHSAQIAVRRALDPDRDDVMLAAIRGGGRPEVQLLDSAGRLLLRLFVFSPGVS